MGKPQGEIGMKVAVLFFSLGVPGALAAFGPGSSGGGPAITCPGPDGKIASVEMLDLYEGRIRFGLTIPELNEGPPGQIFKALGKLNEFDPFMGDDFREALAIVTANQQFLPPGVVMSPGVDLGSDHAVVMPDGCDLRYAGYYESDGTLRISQTTFEKMTSTHQATFYVHETLYWLSRSLTEATNSTATRQVAALLFATGINLKDYADLLNSNFRPYPLGLQKRIRDGKLKITLHPQELGDHKIRFVCYDIKGQAVYRDDLTNNHSVIEGDSKTCKTIIAEHGTWSSGTSYMSIEIDGQMIMDHEAVILYYPIRLYRF